MLAQFPTFADAMWEIFAKTDLPKMTRTFLLSPDPPLESVDVFASCVSGLDTLEATLLNPAGFGALPEDQKLSVR